MMPVGQVELVGGHAESEPLSKGDDVNDFTYVTNDVIQTHEQAYANALFSSWKATQSIAGKTASRNAYDQALKKAEQARLNPRRNPRVDTSRGPITIGTDCSGRDAPLRAVENLKIPYTQIVSS